MASYVAMLRAVNVGGVKIRMDDLKALVSDLAFSGVRTYVQSGNVVFRTGTNTKPASLEGKLEDAISETLGLTVRVLVRSAAELAAIIKSNPFLGRKNIDPKTLHVTFLAEPPDAAVVKAIDPDAGAGDAFQVIGREVY